MTDNPIHNFLDRVKAMTKSRSREMRMTYEEAHGLALSIAQLLVTDAKKAETSDTTVIISGGTLKPSQSE